MVPVIEAACPAALMAGLGRPHRAPPPEPATAGRAVRVPAVTGGTDREEAIALPTGLLTEGLVHGGDARRTTADWTSCPNRGTTRTTGSVCRRARRSRGPGGPSGPSSSLPLRYPKQPGSGHNGGYGRRRPRGRKQPRPPGLAKPRRPRFHTAPTAVIYSGKQEPRTARDPAGASTIVQICALSSERQHEHLDVRVDARGQPGSLHQAVHRANPTVGDRLGLLGDLVTDGTRRQHGTVLIDPDRSVQPALDPSLFSGEGSSSGVVHLKSLSVGVRDSCLTTCTTGFSPLFT